MASGIVFDIREFTIHDGPGSRATVFLKDCPLACAWCHNPERLDPHRVGGSPGRRRPDARLAGQSDDNPYSEAQFKTLKYRPGFPDRFGSIEDARAFCADFFAWYNGDHRHSGIAMFTPADVHHGRTDRLLEARADVLAGAYAAHPERFVKGPPRPASIPAEVWINRPLKEVPQA